MGLKAAPSTSLRAVSLSNRILLPALSQTQELRVCPINNRILSCPVAEDTNGEYGKEAT
jgi:hypothetical protein